MKSSPAPFPNCLQGKLHGLSFAKVVALEYEDDNETEPMEAGPELVVRCVYARNLYGPCANQSQVFNCAVYQRSMTPPVRLETANAL